jgi:hypothetical protein
MKKNVLCALLFCAAPLFVNADATTDNNLEHIPYDLHREHDTTDIFAIPLDDSEEEEKLEMQQLEALQNKLEEKAKTKSSK